MRSDFKIRIFQPIVPEYRIALFDGVCERYPGRIDLHAAERCGQDTSCALHKMPFDYSHRFLRIGPFVWQIGLSLDGLTKGDVIVVCGDVHQLSSLWLAMSAKAKGIKVVWWGHHKTATSKAFGVWIRIRVAKLLSDVYLCYTDTGKKWLMAHGFAKRSVFATGNTIDQVPIKAAMSKWDTQSIEAWKKEHCLLGKNLLLCCSVLRPKTRLDMAIRALASKTLTERNTVLAIIGDGPAKEDCERLAKELGVAERVIWVGATRDQEVMAPWFLAARLFVYPGAIGLSILHAFSYGLPVVTHSNVNHQMPEFEVMEDGKTGAVFDEGDVNDMVVKIATLLDVPSGLLEMSGYVKRLAYERYSMNNMVDNYCEAIETAAQIGRKKHLGSREDAL